MRYTLFGYAEGVLAQSTDSLWAAVHEELVVDASISARTQGVRNGMSEKTARALVPGIVLHPPAKVSDTIMPLVWGTIESYTPWIEVFGNNQFYAQIPATAKASKEIREVVRSLNEVLSAEQRVRLGLAECKTAARALVEWSRQGTVPGAGLFVMDQQQLIVSPNIVGLKQGDTDSFCNWVSDLPVSALWSLPIAVRRELIDLGVFTFGQFQNIPDDILQRRFGREIWLLKALFRDDEIIPAMANSLRIPKEYTQSWTASMAESLELRHVAALVEILLEQALQELRAAGMSTGRLQLNWETDVEKSQFSRVLRQPLCTKDALWGQLLPGIQNIRGNCITYLQLCMQEISPTAGRQMSFTVKNNVILPVQHRAVERLNDVLRHVNQKFPHKLKRGLKAGFRELRLEALNEL